MAQAYVAPVLSAALEKFKEIVKSHAEACGAQTPLIVFCEDRLSLVAERAVCEAVGGTFSVTITTFSRFLSEETGGCENLLSSQGSAMAVRRLIEKNREKLQLFKRLSTATAAQDVYDTIALLYSSKISAEDIAAVSAPNALLSRKLHDLSLLYGEYMTYLEESGAVDRNVYLRRLPDVIRFSERVKNSDIMFFGFQAFTSSVSDCVRASFKSGKSVCGLFIGSSLKKYVNEGWTAFIKLAEECGIKAQSVMLSSPLNCVAEHLRRHAFEADGLNKNAAKEAGGTVCIAEAADVGEECAFIASQVLKRVQTDGVRYREISVMLPDLNAYQPHVERAFSEYGVPFYVDRRYSLASHPICSFIADYLTCAIDGCLGDSVAAVVNSPLFTVEGEGATEGDKHQFINYLLRAANFRGGVKKDVNPDICADEMLDMAATERVRAKFLKGFAHVANLDKKSGHTVCEGIQALLKEFNAGERLKELSSQAQSFGYAAAGVMSARAYGETLKVIAEAQKLVGDERLPLKEFLKILKSGFTAAEISLIQPKQDAVFISDLSACVNTGSKVLFVAGLTEAVPSCSQDTAILTDGELSSLEKIKVAISPKISQVNARVREVTALNLCAFSKNLYLIYPVKCGGEECGVSEVIDYAKRIFTVNGSPIRAQKVSDLILTEENFIYYACRPQPALKALQQSPHGKNAACLAKLIAQMKERGMDTRGYEGGKKSFSPFNRARLFGGSISPTALETYFTCPYKAFMQQGLKLKERRESAFRPLDSGNFIHAVLEEVAKKLNGCSSEEQLIKLAEGQADELLKSASFATPSEDAGAGYTAQKLKEEAIALSLGMYDQLKNSAFTISATEKPCSVNLGDIKVGGRIDRVDTCGDMVRVIDYKTGVIDDSPASYYMGLKLQLPLYLAAAASGKRAAGAYYFPANLEYSQTGGDKFPLKGFMDGSEEVVKSSDTTVQESQRSGYVGAYLNGRKVDRAMSKEDFSYFISYSGEIAKRGAKQLTEGAVTPSPVENSCEHCPFGGCCGFDKESGVEREEVKADCKTIAEVMKAKEGGV